MKYSAIFFDLDGTLLPMDLDEFTQTYFKLLSARFPQFDPKAFVAGVWKGTMAMVTNDGSMTNEDRFWSVFASLMGEDIRSREPEFADFYETDFHKIKAICGENPLAKTAVELARRHADKVVLATNPIFPHCGVRSRLRWIGLTPEDFDYITTYENSSFCKPSARYYQNICDQLQVDPAQCLMIGNDIREDAHGAAQIGMQTHIVTDSLITHDLNLNDRPHSTFAELVQQLSV